MFSERGAREGLLGSWPRGHAGKTSCAESWGWEGGRERGRRKMCAVIFKKPISYCRFVSADPERTSVAHTQCTYTGGALPPLPPPKTAGGEAWGLGLGVILPFIPSSSSCILLSARLGPLSPCLTQLPGQRRAKHRETSWVMVDRKGDNRGVPSQRRKPSGWALKDGQEGEGEREERHQCLWIAVERVALWLVCVWVRESALSVAEQCPVLPSDRGAISLECCTPVCSVVLHLQPQD